MRRVEPTRFGSAIIQNCSESDIVMPTFARLMTMIVHSTQMLNPRFSAKIEKTRFLRAIALPVCSQKASSSGLQSSIQRPRVRNFARPRASSARATGASVIVLMPAPCLG
jgi:hypothetical protein